MTDEARRRVLDIGRAGLIDHEALVEALRTAALRGAISTWMTPTGCRSRRRDDLDGYPPKAFDLVFANAAQLVRAGALVNGVDPGRGFWVGSDGTARRHRR